MEPQPAKAADILQPASAQCSSHFVFEHRQSEHGPKRRLSLPALQLQHSDQNRHGLGAGNVTVPA